MVKDFDDDPDCRTVATSIWSSQARKIVSMPAMVVIPEECIRRPCYRGAIEMTCRLLALPVVVCKKHLRAAIARLSFLQQVALTERQKHERIRAHMAQLQSTLPHAANLVSCRGHACDSPFTSMN